MVYYAIEHNDGSGLAYVVNSVSWIVNRYGRVDKVDPQLIWLAPCVANEAVKRLNRRAAEREAAAMPKTIGAAARAIEDRFFAR